MVSSACEKLFNRRMTPSEGEDMEGLSRRYEFISRLCGSLDNEVFLVEEKATGTRYLLKALRRDATGPGVRIDRKLRFRREMELVSALDHQHIAAPVTTYSSETAYAIVYPSQPGRTLSEILEKGPSLPPRETLTVVAQLLSALEHVHGRGIIHCDIAPHNIFIADQGGVLLLDFGLALWEEQAAALPEGRVLGTLPYLSPEQMGVTDSKIDSRSDLFCVGVILYRLLVGELPFPLKENSVAELIHLTLRTEVHATKTLSIFTNGLLLKALKVSPDERYQTAAGMRHDVLLAMKEDEGQDLEYTRPGMRDEVIAVNRMRLFVGRENEVAMLEKALARAIDGTGSAFLLHGESGVGKTEIVREFAMRRPAGGHAGASVKCSRFTPSQPYSVVRNIVLELVRELSTSAERNADLYRDIVTTRLAEHAGVVCRIIPEMRSFFTEVGEPHEVDRAREADRVIHVLSLLVETLSQIRPLAVFIDDFQWVDHSSFEVIRRVLSRIPETRCLLILSYRSRKSRNLHVHGCDLRELEHLKLVGVRRFRKREVVDLVSSRFSLGSDNELLAETLLERTDGTPMAIAEACRFLVTSSVVRQGKDGWFFSPECLDQLPDSFDPLDLILKRVKVLNDKERLFLEVASLIQGGFEPAAVQTVAGFEEHETSVMCGRLQDLGFLVRSLGGRYAFCHDRLQEAVWGGVPADRKSEQYEALGDYYSRRSVDDREKLFTAAECQLKGKNLGKSVEACWNAAQYALEKAAFDLAIPYYQHAQFMIPHCRKQKIPISVSLVSVKIALGEALRLAGRNEQALKMLQSALSERDGLGPEHRVDVKFKVGSILHNIGRFDESTECFKENLHEIGLDLPGRRALMVIGHLLDLIREFFMYLGLRKLVGAKPSSRVTMTTAILNKLGYSLYFQDLLTAWCVHFKAFVLAKRLNPCAEKAEAYSLHSVGCYQMFMKKRAMRYAKRSLWVAASARRKDAIAFSEYLRGDIEFFRCHWKESDRHLRASISTFNSIGDFTNQIQCHEPLWRMGLSTGDLSQAEAGCRTTISLCNRAKERHFLVCAEAGLYLVRLLMNAQKDSGLLEEINERMAGFSNYLTHTRVGTHLLEAEILEGKWPQAYQRAKSLAGLVLKKDFNSEYNVPVFALLCELLVDEMRARVEGRETIPVSRRALRKDFRRNMFLLWFFCRSYPAYRGAFNRCLAWYFALHSMRGLASMFFKRAIRLHHGLGMKYEEGKSYRDFAVFLDEFRHLPGEAGDCREKAVDLFRECGAELELNHLGYKEDQGGEEGSGREDSRREATEDTTFFGDSGMHKVRVDSLYEVSASLAGAEDIDTLLRRILEGMIRATGAESGCLRLDGDEEHDAQELVLDFEGNHPRREDIPVSEAIVSRMRETNRSVLIRDGAGDDMPVGEETERIRSALCLPLTKPGGRLGYVYLASNKVKGLFSESARKAAQILSAQAGVLVENAYLMDVYRRLNLKLEKKVKEQTADIREKNRRLEDNNLKLVEAERMRELLSGTLVHDIKNYLAGVEGNLKILRRRRKQDHQIVRTITLVLESCSDITNLSSNLLDIGKIEEGRMELNVEELTEEHIRAMADKFGRNIIMDDKEVSIEVHVPAHGCRIMADSYLFGRVLHNLFTNAAKYAPREGRVAVSVEEHPDEHHVCFFSSGRPIPPEHHETLFDKYGRMGGRSQYSKGLGLFFCKMVLLAHGGRIWLETSDEGNVFKMALKKDPPIPPARGESNRVSRPAPT